MFKLSRLPMFFVLLALISPVHAKGWDVKTVLDRLIHTYGGEDNLRKMDNMVQQWDFVALMGNRHGTDVRRIRAPDQLRVELNYPEKSEIRILNGDRSHVIFNDGVVNEVSGMQQDAMRLQSMRLYSPLMLRTKTESMSLLEQGDLLALSLAENGVHVYYMVNMDTWQIEKVAGSLMMNGREVKFLTEYSKFAVEDGVLVHHHENKFANGVNTAVLQLRKITFDAGLDNHQFEP